MHTRMISRESPDLLENDRFVLEISGSLVRRGRAARKVVRQPAPCEQDERRAKRMDRNTECLVDRHTE